MAFGLATKIIKLRNIIKKYSGGGPFRYENGFSGLGIYRIFYYIC